MTTFMSLIKESKKSQEDNEVRTKEPGVQAVEEIDTEELTEQYALQVSYDHSLHWVLSGTQGEWD